MSAARTSRSIVLAVVVLLAVLVVPAGPKALAAGCSYDAESRLLTVTLAPGETVTLSVAADGMVLEDGSTCAPIGGGDRVAIVIDPEAGAVAADETVALELPFPDGVPISVSLGDGTSDRVLVLGTDQPDVFSFDGLGMFAPLRISTGGVERFELDAGAGNDSVDASVSDVDSGSFDLPLTIRGGPGDDRLTGGPLDDRVLGDEGDDRLDGSTGIDHLYGGGGTDLCDLDGVEMSCDPSISVSPQTVEPDGSLSINGAGWYPENGAVDLSVRPADGAAPSPLEPVIPDASWSITTTVAPPSAGGTYTLHACQPCTEPVEEVSQPFTVHVATTTSPTPSPAVAMLGLRPPQASPGEPVEAVGTGWDPNAGRVRIFIDPAGSTSEPDARARVRPDGGFAVPIGVPELEDGSYTVLACQRCGAGDRVEDTATLIVAAAAPAPWPWVAVGGALAIAVLIGLALRRARARRRRPPVGRIGASLRPALPDVRVVARQDGQPHHSVGLALRDDPGVLRIRERSTP